MKRKITLLLALATMVGALAGCGKFTCDICGQEKSGKSYKSEFLGQEIVMCQDCKDDFDAIQDGFEDITDGLSDLFN